MGLVHQAIDRAPVWLIKKLTATYLTLGLGDIGKEVGIDSPEEVRETILSMVSTHVPLSDPAIRSKTSISWLVVGMSLTLNLKSTSKSKSSDRLRGNQREYLGGRDGDVLGSGAAVLEGRAGQDARRRAGAWPAPVRDRARREREQGVLDEGLFVVAVSLS